MAKGVRIQFTAISVRPPTIELLEQVVAAAPVDMFGRTPAKCDLVHVALADLLAKFKGNTDATRKPDEQR